MRILISAYSFFPAIGGLEEQSLLLALEWIKMGHTVDILTEKESPTQANFEVYKGIRIYRIPYVKNRTYFDLTKIIFFLSAFILKRRNGYDFCMLRAAITLYPLIFAFWKYVGCISYTTYLTADTGGEHDEITLIKHLPFQRLLRPIYGAHDYYNSICEANALHYQEIQIPKNKLTRISNGIVISTKRFTQPEKIGTFLFLGRLFIYKGIRELLAAFKMYLETFPSDRLVIGGIGDEKQFVLDFISKNNLSQAISYVGMVTNEQKENFFSHGDCLVLPSYSEGFPISILEAMQNNKAIITSDVSDLVKLFSDDILFCKKKSVSDLLRVMIQLKKDYSSKKFLYEKYLKNYDISIIAKKIIDLA